MEFLDGTMQLPDRVFALMLTFGVLTLVVLTLVVLTFVVLTFVVLTLVVLPFRSIQAAMDLLGDPLQLATLFVKTPFMEVPDCLMEMLQSLSQALAGSMFLVTFPLVVAFPPVVAFLLTFAIALTRAVAFAFPVFVDKPPAQLLQPFTPLFRGDSSCLDGSPDLACGFVVNLLGIPISIPLPVTLALPVALM
ncbi:MAG: hypothetical protein QGH11_05435, partial [Pirellulaceae bacterium]|nr:hypothetical protein [Pirellulaceae bacterium]